VVIRHIPSLGPPADNRGPGSGTAARLLVVRFPVVIGVLLPVRLTGLAGPACGHGDHDQHADGDPAHEEDQQEDADLGPSAQCSTRLAGGPQMAGGVTSRIPTPVSRRTPRAATPRAGRVSEYCRSSFRTASAIIAKTPVTSPAQRLNPIAITATMDPTMASCHYADGFTVAPRPALAAIPARYAATAVHTASHDAGPLAYPRQVLPVPSP
jgi:hypothetical protein